MTAPEHAYQSELAKRKAGIATFAQHLARVQLDARNWRAVADHVLAGDYHHADNSTLRAIYIGLSAFHDPKCQQAAERVKLAL